MSPSAERIETELLKRKLKSGDLLISGTSVFEVLDPEVPAGEGYYAPGKYFNVPTTKVRMLTAYGPGTKTEFIPRNDERAWGDVVKVEARTNVKSKIEIPFKAIPFSFRNMIHVLWNAPIGLVKIGKVVGENTVELKNETVIIDKLKSNPALTKGKRVIVYPWEEKT